MSAINFPKITLKAIGSGKKVSLGQPGCPTLLIFHGRNTSEAARSINGPLRDRYPDSQDLLIASVMDLHAAPKFLHGVVEAFIRDIYEESAQELPEKWNSTDYLILLPDWDGKLTRLTGFSNTDKAAGIVLLDSDGQTLGAYQGNELVTEALALLEKAGLTQAHPVD